MEKITVGESSLSVRETYWIKALMTCESHGLNIQA